MSRIPSIRGRFARQAKAIFLAVTLLCGGATIVKAAESDGTIDAAFGNNGMNDYAPFTNESTRPVRAVAISGTKVLTLVTTTNAQYQNSGFGLIMTTANGSYDTSFNTTGYMKFNLSAPVTGYSATELVSTGTAIYVGGTYTSASGGGIFTVKMNNSGVLDNSWGTNGISHILPEFQAFNVKMHIGGTSGSVYYLGYGNYDWLMKLNSSGAIDTTFGRTGANGAGYYMGIFMGSPYGSYVTRSIFGFDVDETTTPASMNIYTSPNGAQIVIQHLKLGTQQTSMSGNSGNINLYQAEADTTWAATSLISGTSTATNGFLRVDVPGNNAIIRGVRSSASFLYVVTNQMSSNAYKVVAIDLSQKRLYSGFGTGGILDISSMNFDTGSGVTGLIAEQLAGDTLFVYGYNASYKGIVGKISGGAIDSTFGTAGVASFTACTTLAPTALVRTTDGGITALAAYQFMSDPAKLRIGRLATGGSTTSCGTTTTASTMPQQNNNNQNNNPNNTMPNNNMIVPLATPVGSAVEVPGQGIRVTVNNLAAGARIAVMIYDSATTISGSAPDSPWFSEGLAGSSTLMVNSVKWTPNGNNVGATISRTTPLVAGVRYRVMYRQVTGSINSQSSNMSANVTVYMTLTADVKAAVAAAGVTVTDTKVYSTAAATPTKVAAESAITVMTPAQAKVQEIVSMTPAVCLPNDDDIVFIDTGKCIAKFINEKTGKVLRSLVTTVVADEVSTLNVGNEIAILAPIYFGAGSSAVTPAGIARIKSIKNQVTAAGSVLLVGHSGILMGNTPENIALAKARATSTAKALKTVGAKGPFYATSAGALDPASNKKTVAAQAKNRRVIIVLVP